MRLLLLGIAAIPAFPVEAHDWFTGQRDPVTKVECCGNSDCHAVDDHLVRELADGGYLYLPRGWTIPWDRVQHSPDFSYYICESAEFLDRRVDRGALEWSMVCFFAPPRGM